MASTLAYSTSTATAARDAAILAEREAARAAAHAARVAEFAAHAEWTVVTFDGDADLDRYAGREFLTDAAGLAHAYARQTRYYRVLSAVPATDADRERLGRWGRFIHADNL